MVEHNCEWERVNQINTVAHWVNAMHKNRISQVQTHMSARSGFGTRPSYEAPIDPTVKNITRCSNEKLPLLK